jgi:hypothetical protein
MRLVELHFICHSARAELLIRGVLQVPACLVLLHVFADDCTVLVVFALLSYSPPDLQVLHGVAFFVFRGALPGNDVCPQRREAQLEYVGRGKRGDDMAGRGIHDRNPAQVC